MQKFYDNYCKKRENEDDLYFFDGFQGEIELKRCNIELQKESELLLVRYANPMTDYVLKTLNSMKKHKLMKHFLLIQHFQS